MAKSTLNLNGPLLKIPNNIKTASFDYVGRYQIIAEIVARYFPNATRANVLLDVGGLGTFLDKVLPVAVKVLDNEVTDTDDRQTNGDGSHMLSVADNSYDVVVTSDTLEHIPENDRKLFVQELVRTSKDLVIICAPFADAGAAHEEQKLQQFYTTVTGTPHRWLKEHAAYGLPIEQKIVSYIPSTVRSVEVFHQSDLDLWRDMLAVNLFANEIADRNVQSAKRLINKTYNDIFLFRDFCKDNYYRTFIVISKQQDITINTPAAKPSPEEQAHMLGLVNDFYIQATMAYESFPGVIKLKEKLNEMRHQYANQQAEYIALQAQYDHVLHSKVWRYSTPLRVMMRSVRKVMRVQE